MSRRLWLLLSALIAIAACVQIQVGGERKTEVGTIKTEKKDEKPDRPDRTRPSK